MSGIEGDCCTPPPKTSFEGDGVRVIGLYSAKRFALRVGDDCAAGSSCESASDVLQLRFVAVEAGRLLTRCGESGCSGDDSLAGNSKAVGGSMLVVDCIRCMLVLLGVQHSVCVSCVVCRVVVWVC